VLDGPCEIEAHTQLPAGERVEVPRSRPATQEVDATATELAGARAGQDEADAALLDQAVDLVEQLRQALDLVDDGPRKGGPEMTSWKRRCWSGWEASTNTSPATSPP